MKKTWKRISIGVLVISLILFTFVLYSFLTTMREWSLRSAENKDLEKMIALSLSNQEELDSLIFEQEQMVNGGGVQEEYEGNTRSMESKVLLYQAFREELNGNELLSFQVLDDRTIMARYKEAEGKLLSEIYAYAIEGLEEEKFQFTLLHQREDEQALEEEQRKLALSSAYPFEEYDFLRTIVEYDIEEQKILRYRPQSVFSYYITKSPDGKWGILVKSKEISVFSSQAYSPDMYLVNLETEEEVEIAKDVLAYSSYGGSNWKPDSSKVIMSEQRIFDLESKEFTQIQLPFQQEKIMSILGKEEEILMLVQKGEKEPYSYEWHAFDWSGRWLDETPIIGVTGSEMYVRQAAVIDDVEGTVLVQIDSYSEEGRYGILTYLVERNGEVKELEKGLEVLPLAWKKQFLVFQQMENPSIALYNSKGELIESRSYEELLGINLYQYNLVGIDKEKNLLYFAEPWSVLPIESSELVKGKIDYRYSTNLKALVLDSMKSFDLVLNNLKLPLYQWGYVNVNGFDGKTLSIEVYQDGNAQ